MSATERAAALRAEADALDTIADLEATAAQAKAKYQAHPTEKYKEAHRAASAALTNEREARRAVLTEQRDATVTATGASAAATPGKVL